MKTSTFPSLLLNVLHTFLCPDSQDEKATQQQFAHGSKREARIFKVGAYLCYGVALVWMPVSFEGDGVV